jgi:hypothetical protein
MLDNSIGASRAAADALKKIDPEIAELAVAIRINRDLKAVETAGLLGEGGEPLVPLILPLAKQYAAGLEFNDKTLPGLEITIVSLAKIGSQDREVSTLVSQMIVFPGFLPGKTVPPRAKANFFNPEVVKVRRAAIISIRLMKRSKQSLRQLLSVVSTDAENNRVEAVQSLVHICDENNDDVITKALEGLRYDKSPQVRKAVDNALESLKKQHNSGKPGTTVKSQGVDGAWIKSVAAMSPEKQVQAVAKKLQELNPGFDGKVEHKVEYGQVTDLKFFTDRVSDISPVRALVDLKLLGCYGSDVGKGRLRDLSPLKGIHLTTLACFKNEVSDLSPLEGMPLTSMNCGNTKVSDLRALRGMKIQGLFFAGTPISDLSPLRGMPLAALDCGYTKVTDLSPLKGMPLTACYCGGTQVSDLSPLKGMSLTILYCDGTAVTDLGSLKGIPIEQLQCDFKPERDTETLRSIKTLEKINGKPAAEFWKRVDAKWVEKP